MLGANLKTLRKNKGFSQEQLATRLNVVRQTVSKWEQGLSVPDSEMLVKISEVLGASVGELLSVEIAPEKAPALEAVARELEKLNEQLATRQARRQAFFCWCCSWLLFFPNGTCCFTSLGKTCMSGCIELQAKGRVRP